MISEIIKSYIFYYGMKKLGKKIYQKLCEMEHDYFYGPKPNFSQFGDIPDPERY
jgi:hypothetical protein